MSQDNSHHDSDSIAPPDRAAAGDVSTTGHSAHDAHDAHDTHGHGTGADHDDNGHGGHGGHGHDDDAAEVSTLVPTTWKQLIFPALILLLVAILVAGPLFGAFATRPASPTPAPTEQHNGNEEGAPTPGSEVEPTPHSNAPQNPVSQAQPTATANTPATEAPVASPTSNAITLSAAATRTAVRVAGEQGDVARVPVQIEFGGATFTVKSGSNLLPDWKPTQDAGLATWIDGTFANHILYLPFSEQNETLFKGAKTGDKVRVVMNTGQVFEFAITRSERVFNGPPTQDGQFTVSTAMAQDHAGVTLFLVGDPATDRAVVQADFTGTIQ